MSYMNRIYTDLRTAQEKGINIFDYDKLRAYKGLDKDTIKYLKAIGKKEWFDNVFMCEEE